MSRRSWNFARFTVVFLSIACVLVVVLNHSSAQNTPSTQTATPAEPTVEQNHKNIQVLKGLPESQLIPVMNFMATSLGVRCNYCHVNKDGNWDYASDEKGEKKSAREMITMVTGINKNSFRGNPEVSCYTCHRGRSSVQHTLAFPLPSPEPRPSAAPSPATGTAASPPGRHRRRHPGWPAPGRAAWAAARARR